MDDTRPDPERPIPDWLLIPGLDGDAPEPPFERIPQPPPLKPWERARRQPFFRKRRRPVPDKVDRQR